MSVRINMSVRIDMLPIKNIVIEEYVNNVDDIYTFKCKECNIECETHVSFNNNISIHKLCKYGLINLHKEFLERILTTHHLLNNYIRRKNMNKIRK